MNADRVAGQGVNHLSCLSPGVPVCGVGERAERPLAGLPDRQQPDPHRAQDNRDGGDGGGVSVRRALMEPLLRRRVVQ